MDYRSVYRDIFPDEIINLTGKNILTYDSHGDVVCIPPKKISTKAIPKKQKRTMYIVSKRAFEIAEKNGRNLEDLVEACFAGKGYGGKDIWSLKQYETRNRVYPASK